MTRAPSPWGDTSRKHMKHRAGGTCQTCGRVLTINVDGHIRLMNIFFFGAVLVFALAVLELVVR